MFCFFKKEKYNSKQLHSAGALKTLKYKNATFLTPIILSRYDFGGVFDLAAWNNVDVKPQSLSAPALLITFK